jgi:hypothetical protein
MVSRYALTKVNDEVSVGRTRLILPICGYRIKAITPAFQAGDEGSIPSIRSMDI